MDAEGPIEPDPSGPTGDRPRIPGDLASRPGVRVAVWAILVLVLGALSWPIPDARIAPGIDRSWQIGLHLAAGLNLRSGVDLVFTYGPLGYLGSPSPYLGPTSAIALAACIAVYVALTGVLLAAARRILPAWAAAAVVLLIGRAFAGLPPFEAFQALTVVVAANLLGTRPRLRPELIATAFGVLAGIAVLGKINVAVFVAVVAAATAMALDRRWWRGLAIAAASGLVTALVLWLVTGQRLGDLAAYASGSIQIVNGYSESMGLDIDPGVLWTYLAFVATVLLGGWVAWRATWEWPRRRRIAFLAIALLIAFAEWKTLATRNASSYAFATILMFVAVVGARGLDRRTWLLSVAVVGMAFAGSARPTPGAVADVVGSARSLAVEVVTAVVPGRAARAVEHNQATLRARYALDETTLGELAGQRVAIDPVESGVAFAYPELVWDPLPVLQSYSAYTPALDAVNAARFASPEAPDRILRQVSLVADPPDWLTRQLGRPLRPRESVPFVVDGRYRWFEAPAAMLQTFCRYRELSSIGAWQVLARSGGSCGQPEALRTVRAREGESVPVPSDSRPGRFVIVRVRGIEPTLLGRIRTTVFKGEEWYVTIDGLRYRLVAATAPDGLLVAVPPEVAGTGANAFRPIEALSIASPSHATPRTLTYEFLTVPLVTP